MSYLISVGRLFYPGVVHVLSTNALALNINVLLYTIGEPVVREFRESMSFIHCGGVDKWVSWIHIRSYSCCRCRFNPGEEKPEVFRLTMKDIH